MILAILQARVSSTRLPGKVLKPILGRPMLELHLERLSRLKKADRLVVAASSEPDDTPIAHLCHRLDVACARGSLNDVLDRFHTAARAYGADTIVRLTGDCPLADPAVIDDGIDYFCRNRYDYVSNCTVRTFPIGLDFEIFTIDSLREAWREAFLPSEREHVTPFMKNHRERFSVGHFTHETDLSHHRWTVDEPEDFAFVAAVYEALYPQNPRFAMSDILRLLRDHPELTKLNYHIVHGEGLEKSLDEDKRYLAGRA